MFRTSWITPLFSEGTGSSPLGHLHLERTQAYSDAILSVIATVLATPLLQVTEASQREILITGRTLRSVLTSPYRLQAMSIYYCVFMFVTLVWFWQGAKFHGLSNSDHPTILIYANYLELLVTSLLPFAASSAANADSSSSGKASHIFPLYVNIFVVALTHLFFQGLALYSRKDKRKLAWLHIEEGLAITTTCGLALILGIWETNLAFLIYLGIAPIVFIYRKRFASVSSAREMAHRSSMQSSTAQIERRLQTQNEADDRQDVVHNIVLSANQMDWSSLTRVDEQRECNDTYSSPLLREEARRNYEGEGSHEAIQIHQVFKSRLEAFTDGIIAIAATLIVLELKPTPPCKDLTNPEDCILHWRDGCRPAMPEILKFQCIYDDTEATARGRLLMISYVSTFVVLNILHAQHHAIFDSITQNVSDLYIQMLNAHFCVLVGMLPFGFTLVSQFAIQPLSESYFQTFLFERKTKITPDQDAAATACTFAGVILLLTSTCLLGLYIRSVMLEQKTPSIADIVRFSIVPLFCLAVVISLALGADEVIFLWTVLLLPVIVIVTKHVREAMPSCLFQR